MKRCVRVYAACAALLMAATAMAQSDDRTRVFNAPMDRVWAVAKSNLKSLGWDVDKEDREVGWMVTDSRRLEGDDFGVYAKGTKHRLRLIFKSLDSGKKTSVTVERKVWKNERILWMDKDEPIQTTDQTVQKSLLAAIRKSL